MENNQYIYHNLRHTCWQFLTENNTMSVADNCPFVFTTYVSLTRFSPQSDAGPTMVH